MKTYMAKKGEIDTKWYVADVADKVLGRAATKIATILMGKHRPQYTPHTDTGDFVVIINAEKIRLTSQTKPFQRQYHSYSGYPDGLKTTTMAEMMQKNPEKVVREAVRRMLPKTKLGRVMLGKLKVYTGPEHPHQAQQPENLEI